MFNRRFQSIGLIVLFALVALMAAPSVADAQYRGPYGPYGPYGPWGPYGSYRYDPRDEFSASVRIDVEPNEAEVYVNGARAGVVDDFDSWYQRLWVRPGNHEIAIYLDGYRTVRQELYLTPGSGRTIRLTMERGTAGPRPVPNTVENRAEQPRDPRAPRDPRTGQYTPPEPPQRELPRREPAAVFGTLSLRVTPSDAEILVDGERWTGAAVGDRLAIKLGAGRHRIEVRKTGYAPYTEDVLIRNNGTLTLNVSLTRRQALNSAKLTP